MRRDQLLVGGTRRTIDRRFDFETTLPSAIEELVRLREERQGG